MASATIPHRSAPSKGKPDPQRILQVYEYEKRTHGARGAYRRAGEMLGVSDETVRRAVHAAEVPAVAPTPDELVYVPPPGGYPEPKPLPQMAQDGASSAARNATDEPQIEASPSGDITSSQDATIAVGSPETALPHEEEPQPAIATRHSDEPDLVDHAPPAVPQNAAGFSETPQPLPIPVPDPEPAPDPHPDPRPVPIPDPPPIVQRVVVREVQTVGLLDWVRTHEVLSKQLLGLAVFLVLVALTWLG